MADFIFLDGGRIRPESGGSVIKAADYAVMREPRQVLADAREYAEGVVKDADAVYRSERERGYREGMREARQQMAEQLVSTALRCELHYRELREQTILLVMEIFNKVLQDIEPRQLVAAQVKKALGAFKGRKRVVVKVHPSRAEMLHDQLTDIMAGCPGIDLIEIKAAPHLSADELILESETGIVEASMAVQLAAIREAFQKELNPNVA
jgi:type III secretion protein L